MKQIGLGLLRDETDLYQETTCIMKQLWLDLSRDETDLYQNTTRIKKQVGVSPFTKTVEVTCIKNYVYQKSVKGPGYYVKKDDLFQ